MLFLSQKSWKLYSVSRGKFANPGLLTSQMSLTNLADKDSNYSSVIRVFQTRMYGCTRSILMFSWRSVLLVTVWWKKLRWSLATSSNGEMFQHTFWEESKFLLSSLRTNCRLFQYGWSTVADSASGAAKLLQAWLFIVPRLNVWRLKSHYKGSNIQWCP